MPKDPTNKPVTNKAEAAEANLEEEIRRRAYELYEARGREDGQALDDWLRAEAEISAETKFERFGEIKTYRELGREQGNPSVPLSTLKLVHAGARLRRSLGCAPSCGEESRTPPTPKP